MPRKKMTDYKDQDIIIHPVVEEYKINTLNEIKTLLEVITIISALHWITFIIPIIINAGS